MVSKRIKYARAHLSRRRHIAILATPLWRRVQRADFNCLVSRWELAPRVGKKWQAVLAPPLGWFWGDFWLFGREIWGWVGCYFRRIWGAIVAGLADLNGWIIFEGVSYVPSILLLPTVWTDWRLWREMKVVRQRGQWYWFMGVIILMTILEVWYEYG